MRKFMKSALHAGLRNKLEKVRDLSSRSTKQKGNRRADSRKILKLSRQHFRKYGNPSADICNFLYLHKNLQWA